MQKVKCAIYVRKSTEKGLEQEFNSLHNQEDACKSYILSQAFNGWEYTKTYEDGGISGGTMKRPALLEMLEDMKRGDINVVVVYKLDRLSRSILDFHKMMKIFETNKCDFVSITQAFDTSNSMGKLTLNMLLSFAQFEREISSERVKDKIAASKKKGLWTGGSPKLGYDIKDKKLIINPTEDETVKEIFEEYLRQPSLIKATEVLNNKGIRLKEWITQKGDKKGGKKVTPASLARILKDKTYIGKIENKKDNQTYDGQHQAIINKETWNKVQDKLRQNGTPSPEKYNTKGFLLTGLLQRVNGDKFKNTQSNGKKNIYTYYQIDKTRLPTGNINKIAYTLTNKLSHNKQPIEIFDKIIYQNEYLTFYIRKDNPNIKQELFEELKYDDNYEIETSLNNEYILIKEEIILTRKGVTNEYFIKRNQILTKKEIKKTILEGLGHAWKYREMLESGISIEQIRKNEKIAVIKIYRSLNLAYLSPNIINNILNNNFPSNKQLSDLYNIESKYITFKDQENYIMN